MEKTTILLKQMVQAIIDGDELLMRESEQTIWRLNLSLDKIAEPSLDNPLEYVLTACILKEMNNVWQQKGREGFNVPRWAMESPSLVQGYSVISAKDIAFWENEECNKVFIAHNIFAPENYLLFY